MFDVIGDVHGEFDKLVALLRHLGYSDSNGTYRHPSRRAIFVGDLIDRGPAQLDTVNLVRRIVDAGTAQCIMGNHEFNAIAWATEDPDHPGEYLRSRTKPGNRAQHAAFLAEVEGTPRHEEIIAWFRTLPLWLDLGGLRIVHACWHEASMHVLRPVIGADQTLTDKAVLQGSRSLDPVFEAIEVICKGPEVPLPNGVSIMDKDGKVRHNVRLRWWLPDIMTSRDAVIVPPGNQSIIPDVSFSIDWTRYQYSGPPVLFGHYWFTGVPRAISPQFACLDYSVAKGGQLVAYRWDGEEELSTDKLVWV